MPATYEPIQTYTLGSATTNITFNSIGSSYTDLRIVLTASFSSTGAALRLRFNSDTGTNYSFTSLYGNGSSANSYRETSTTYIPLDSNFGIPNTQWSLWTMDIFSYAGSTNKTVLTTGNTDNNGSGIVYQEVGLWRNTNAITAVEVSLSGVNFSTGTTATLYGIKAA
jgi:hypothetical protein